MPLTDVSVRNAKPAGKVQRLFDSAGLYVEVSPAGGRWWRLKYRFAGTEKRLSLGTYPQTTLKVARERRDAARKLLDDGTDPSADRKAERVQAHIESDRAFRKVAAAWLEHNEQRWASSTRSAIEASLEADAYPLLGDTLIADIRARHVLAVVHAMEPRGVGETTSSVLQRIKAIFRYAVVHEWIDSNPLLDLRAEEVLKPRQVKHRAALPESEPKTLISKLAAYDSDATTAAALKLLMLTVVRPGELRGARWEEIDLTDAVWRIPPERMKMCLEHVVPLSRQAMELLTARQISVKARIGLVFPRPSSRCH